MMAANENTFHVPEAEVCRDGIGQCSLDPVSPNSESACELGCSEYLEHMSGLVPGRKEWNHPQSDAHEVLAFILGDVFEYHSGLDEIIEGRTRFMEGVAHLAVAVLYDKPCPSVRGISMEDARKCAGKSIPRSKELNVRKRPNGIKFTQIYKSVWLGGRRIMKTYSKGKEDPGCLSGMVEGIKLISSAYVDIEIGRLESCS